MQLRVVNLIGTRGIYRPERSGKMFFKPLRIAKIPSFEVLLRVGEDDLG